MFNTPGIVQKVTATSLSLSSQVVELIQELL